MTLTESMNKVAVDLHNDAVAILNNITELEKEYNSLQMLSENRDVEFLKNLMKEKLFLGLNCDTKNLSPEIQKQINEVFPL